MANQQITIKCNYADDLRRFTVEADVPLLLLHDHIAKMFDLDPKCVRLSQGEIPVLTDAALASAIDTSGTVLRLQVTESFEPAVDQPPATALATEEPQVDTSPVVDEKDTLSATDAPLMYGQEVSLRNMHGPCPFLDSNGYAKSGDRPCKYDVSTCDGIRNETTTWWVVVPADGEAKEGPVMYGDVVHLKNLHGGGSFLDTYGHSPQKGAKYDVITVSEPRGETSQWVIEGGEGPVTLGSSCNIVNQYAGKSYLDTNGRGVRGRGAAGYLYDVSTSEGIRTETTGSWVFQPMHESFDCIVHLPTQQKLAVTGKTLPSGRICFRLQEQQHNVAMGPMGKVHHQGGQGPWAQFTAVATPEGFMLKSHGNAAKGWCLDLIEGAFVCCSDEATAPSWMLMQEGSAYTPGAPKEWYAAKLAAKLAKSIEQQVQESPEQTPTQCMRSTIVLRGNRDGRDTAVGSHLAVHGSYGKDIFDKNATFTIATNEATKASIWSVEQGGWIPKGHVALSIAGNVDGRECAKEWTLMVAKEDKSPHQRDGQSAYVVSTRSFNKKGGLWAIEPCEDNPALCYLRYAGNRDGRGDAKGWYLAVHNSRKSDARDPNSLYCIVTRDARKASIWEVRPFWAPVPVPSKPPLQLDAAGNPKIGFHTAKKAALPAIRDALLALFHPQSEDTTESPPMDAQAAAAAIHSLRVAVDWLHRKSGLPISIGELQNDEALQVVAKLRSLPADLPKWANRQMPMTEDAPQRVDAMVQALAAPMQHLWCEALAGEDLEAPEYKEKVKAEKQQQKAEAKAAKEQQKVEAKAAKEREKAEAKAAKELEKAEAKASKAAAKAAKKQGSKDSAENIDDGFLEIDDCGDQIVAVIDPKIPQASSDNFTVGYNGHAIVNGTQGWAEYEFSNDTLRIVQIATQYNARDARPLQLTVNGTVVSSAYVAEISGSWHDPAQLIWGKTGPIELPAGTITLRLETQGFFPHLWELVVTELPLPQYAENVETADPATAY